MDSVKNRFYVALDSRDMKEIRGLLRQTTNLWNCLVYHVGEAVLEVARSSKDTAAILPQIDTMVKDAYRILILEEDLGIPFEHTEDWKIRVKQIRELPTGVAMNRVDDLVQAYRYAHTKYGDGTEYPYAPSTKVRGSTQTARFSPKDWSKNGDIVKLNLGDRFLIFPVEGIGEVEDGKFSLTITKKRLSRTRAQEITNGIEATSLYISLSTE